MTQLELPPISFARYLDLLRRRKWQVVPVSLLGLLIGACVALLLPRYYVATASAEFRGDLIGLDSGKDPMAALLESAELTIKDTVPDVVEALGWQEGRHPDEAARRAFYNAVRGRVKLVQVGRKDDKRSIANVELTYRDTDPDRAKEFCDSLLETWVADRRKGIEDQIDGTLRGINKEIERETQTKSRAEQEKRNFERLEKINPQDWSGATSDGGRSAMSRRQQELGDDIDERERRKKDLEEELGRLEERQLNTNRKRRRTVQASELPKALQDAMGAATAEMVYALLALQNARPGHPNYEGFQEQLAEAQKKLGLLKEQAGADQVTEEDNPDYLELIRQQDKATTELESVNRELADKRETKRELDAEIDRYPDVGTAYARHREDVSRAQKALDALRLQKTDAEAKKRQLQFQQPYSRKTWAWVPPIATEPNVYLVALAGSAIGLAVAIGLILLFDVLQTTFKTTEDVSHALSVPVLGTMAHMMTDDQRQRATVRRTRVALIAATFLLLSLTIVTIYYVSPARLPAGVRDVLQLILGDSSGAK